MGISVRSEGVVQYRVGERDAGKGRDMWGPVQSASDDSQVTLTANGPDGSAMESTVNIFPVKERGRPIHLPPGLTVRSCRVWGVDRVEEGTDATKVYLHNWPLPTLLPLGG